MGNLCCTPSVSGSGPIDYQSSPDDADRPSTQEPRRNSSPAGTGSLPIGPRSSSSERIATLTALPDELQEQIGNLVGPRDRSALRQTAQVFNQALPRGDRDAMHTIQGAHALLDLAQTAGSDGLARAVREVIEAVPTMPRWQGKADLLLAAQHVVQQREDLPERRELQSEIASAIQASGLSGIQRQAANDIFATVLNARADHGAEVR